jgi:hypothetical protein
VRVKSVGKSRYQDGKSLNFNVGASFGLNYGESISRSFSIAPLKWIKKIASTIKGNTGVVITGALDGFSSSTSGSTSNGYGQGSSITSGTYLAMQRAKMNIKFNTVEKCVSIRLNEFFINKTKLLLKLKPFLAEEKLGQAITEGLFICSGKDEEVNRYYPEKYYYFTQHFVEGDMLDKGDLRNHPWLLALRGERDYVTFINKLRTSRGKIKSRGMNVDLFGLSKYKYAIDGGVRWFFNSNSDIQDSYLAKDVDLANDPLDQLLKVYEQVVPTFPGIYSMRPKLPEFEDQDQYEALPSEGMNLAP